MLSHQGVPVFLCRAVFLRSLGVIWNAYRGNGIHIGLYRVHIGLYRVHMVLYTDYIVSIYRYNRVPYEVYTGYI